MLTEIKAINAQQEGTSENTEGEAGPIDQLMADLTLEEENHDVQNRREKEELTSRDEQLSAVGEKIQRNGLTRLFFRW